MTTILLIDLSSIAHPLWHTTQGSSNPNECSIATVAKVRALASGQRHVAICCDSGRSFRRDIDPTYKAQRPESDATLQHQITLARETLVADGFPVWAVKGFEADDLIATATVEAARIVKPKLGVGLSGQDTIENLHVLIASSDKDLLQLVGDRVTVHKLTDGSQWDAARVQEKLGIVPNQMRDYLSLVGDASDNIKGAEGIGAKKAAALLQKFGTLEDLYAALDTAELSGDVSGFHPSTFKSLTEFRSRMDIVRQLVTLRTDVPLPFEEVFRERVPVDVAVFGEDDSMEAASDENAKATDERRETAGQEQAQGAQSTPAREVAPQPYLAIPANQPAPPHPSGLAVRDAEVLPPPSGEFGMQLEPRSLTQAIDLAKHMHASRLFSAYGTPQAVLSTIMAGRELGLQSQASLRAFHIIEGKPAFSADLIRALCRKSPLCEYFRIVERSAMKATWVTKRRGDPETTLTYTIEQGRLAWQKGDKEWAASAWGKRPENMLTKTASSTLARLVYDDVVLNMYCVEELTGEERD